MVGSAAPLVTLALHIFALLLIGHYVADYPLQGDFLARAKNRLHPVPGVPWRQALGAHAAIHAGSVYIVTGSLLLALAELVAHAFIDDLKCAGKVSFTADQQLHVFCKLVWALIAAATTIGHAP